MIVLARLLVPKDFGLFGIALLTISAVEIFSRTGFQTALIQKKEDTESYLNTAWTVSALRSVVLFFLLFLSAPLIGKLFNSPQASSVIKVIAITTLLSGFSNIGIIFFQKELEFNKQFIYEISGALVELTVAITLAFILQNVWALVWGLLASSFIRFLLSYALHPSRPHFELNKEKFKDLFTFGKWILGSGILAFLVTQGDDIFVGKMLGVTALGLYQMAFTLSSLPATEITHVISQVTFPTYSKLQDDIPRLREAYLKVLQLTAFLTFPIAGGIFLFAPDFVIIFMGDKWIPIVPALKILVFAGLFRSLLATTGPILHAIGKPKVDTTWQMIRLLILFLSIYPLTLRWGISGTSTAVLLSISVATLGFIIKTISFIKIDIIRLSKILYLPFVNTIIISLIILFYLKNNSIVNWSHLLVVSFISLCLYLVLTFVSDFSFKYGMRNLIKEIIT
jgi:O-antigen/teichoic acid export membrane protein